MFCLFSLNILIIPTLLFVFFLFKNSLSLFYKWVCRIMNFFYLLDLQFPIRFLSPLFVLTHTFCVCSFIFNLFLRVTIFSVIKLFLTVPRRFVCVFLFSLCTVREHTSLFPPVLTRAPLLGRTGWCLSWNWRTFSLASFSSDFRKLAQLLVLNMMSTQIHYLSKNLYSPLCLWQFQQHSVHISHMWHLCAFLSEQCASPSSLQ